MNNAINVLIINIISIIILYIIFLGLGLYINNIIKQEKTSKIKESEEIKNYLQLQNMTTNEIIQFRNKNEFLKTIKDYDTIKYFLKGTEEENTNKLIEWYYPGFKRLG